MKSNRRVGFTLPEVLTALVIMGLVVSTAAQLMATYADTVRAARLAAVGEAASGNRVRWLADLVLGAEVDVDRERAVIGGPDSLVIQTVHRLSDGWPRDDRVTLLIRPPLLLARFGNESIALHESVVDGSFGYLAALGEQSPWNHQWTSTTSAPPAVRLLLSVLERGTVRTDTVLLRIGERG